jgi:hypothetical protein
MVRVRKRWNKQGAPRSIAQMANAVAASIWKLAADVVLNLENENFETTTQGQRVDLLEELACYLVHFCDRWIYTRADQRQRNEFVSCLATDIARLLEDSRVDVQGEGEYRSAFYDKLNRRAGEYARFGYSDAEGCSFSMRCRLGEVIRAVMGERDNRWIPDYIVGREAPAIETALQGSLSALVKFEERTA